LNSQNRTPNPSLWMWKKPDLRCSDYNPLTLSTTQTLEASYAKSLNQK